MHFFNNFGQSINNQDDKVDHKDRPKQIDLKLFKSGADQGYYHYYCSSGPEIVLSYRPH